MGEKKRGTAPLSENPIATGGPKKPEKAGLPGIFSRIVGQLKPSKTHQVESELFEKLFGDLEGPDRIIAPVAVRFTPPPPPKDALDEIGDDGLASAMADLRETAQEINQASTGKEVENVIRVAEKSATPDKMRADAKKGGIGVSEDSSKESNEVKADLEKALAILQKESQGREEYMAMLKGEIRSMAEGEGARVDDLGVFEEVEEEDEWGLRKVRLKVELEGKPNFKLNFIDRENRIVCPVKRNEWFDKAEKFKPTHLVDHPMAKGVLALVERPGKLQFLSQDGELYDATTADIKAYLKSDPQGNEPVLLEAKSELRLAYVSTFVNQVSSFSRRFGDDKKTQSAYTSLVAELNLLNGSLAGEGWTEVLSKIKGLIDSSGLNGGHRAHLYSDLMSVVRNVKLDVEVLDSLFPLAKIESKNCMEWGQFDNGLVMRIAEGDRIRYDLVTVEGKRMYPDDLAFDYVGPFVGQIAPVRKGGKWNFIKKADGKLVGNVEYDEAFEPRQGLTRVRLGQKFNYMTSGGRLLFEVGPSEFFDEADDFDKRGKAQVRIQNEKFSIDTKGGRNLSLSAGVMRVIQSFSAIRKDDRMSKEDRKDNRLALVSDLVVGPEAKEFQRELHLGERLHRIFGSLLVEFPEKADAIVALFGHFRKTLNTRVEKEGGQEQGRSLCGQRVYGEIEGILIQSDVPVAAKARLRQFSLKMAALPWKGIDPLPIPLLASFSALLRRNPEEEVKLIPMLQKLESLTSLYASWSRDNLRKLLPDLEVLLAQAGLQPSTQRQVRDVFLSKMTNSDSYWHRGSSVGSWQPVSQAGKELQGRSVLLSFGPPANRETENDILKLNFAHFCKGISLGDLASVERRLESLGKLVSENPGYAFDHGEMGLALFETIKRLRKSEPEAPSRLMEPAIQALRKAVEKGDRKAKVHFILGELREYRARSNEGILSWLSIGTHHAELSQAADSYGKAMDYSQDEKIRGQIEMRYKKANDVLRCRTRIRWALLLALGLASAGGLAYRFGGDFQLSDFTDGTRKGLVGKPVGPQAEKAVPKSSAMEEKSKQPRSAKELKMDKVRP